MGKYTVPESIRNLKPKGTMVKFIRDKYYVYEFTSQKKPNGKWGIKMGKVIGTIKVGVGFVPNDTFNKEEIITTCEYGEYCIVYETGKNILNLLKESFNPLDSTQIYLMSVFFYVEGFFGLSSLKDYFNQSYFKIKFPDVSMSYHTISELVDSLGRKQERVIKFQKNLVKNSKELAVDGHDVFSYSEDNQLTEYGNKYRKTKMEQFNILMAYDINTSTPVLSKIYPGSILDKISIKDLLSTFELKSKLFIVDNGFYSKENIELFSKDDNQYIIPLSVNLTKYKENISKLDYKNPFLYCNDKQKDTVFYFETVESNGTRIIVYKNMSINIKDSEDYRQKIGLNEKYTEEEYNSKKELFGTIVLQTNTKFDAKTIYEKYRKRWGIETFFNILKNKCGFEAFNESDYYTMQGLSFIMLITGLLDNEFRNKVSGLNMSVPDILTKARFLKIVKKGENWIHGNYSKSSKELMEKFGLDLNSKVVI